MSNVQISSLPGELSLTKLLTTLTMTVSEETFVFLTIPWTTLSSSDHFSDQASNSHQSQDLQPATLPPTLPLHEIRMLYQEQSPPSTTLVLQQDIASQHFPDLPQFLPSRILALNVHSSLEAVGFMAAVAGKLKEKGCSCNAVSAFYHDYIFVPVGTEDKVVKALEELREEAMAE